jgi:hypothetical protein
MAKRSWGNIIFSLVLAAPWFLLCWYCCFLMLNDIAILY